MGKDVTGGEAASRIRVGFVPLLDAAPIIVALELGYFSDESLLVTLERQIGWGNVRDKLVFGHLAASHALLGMPPASRLGRDRFPEPLVAIMSLGAGGNAITLGRQLTDVGVDSLQTLARHVQSRGRGSPAMLAHVFGCSMHHYLLRDWLAGGQIDPDRDVQLCVLPPSQMTRQLLRGCLHGFCAGEPWNTVADRQGLGRIVAATTDVLPDHPEKVLATSQTWLAGNRSAAEPLVRAVLRACAYCADAANYPALAQLLSLPQYLDMKAEWIMASLTVEKWFGSPTRRPGGPIRNCSKAMTFPSATHAAWILREMRRWGHLPPDADVMGIARKSVDSGPYRRAAESMQLECPPDDFPKMRLRTGWFDPRGAPTAPTGLAAVPT